MYLLAHERKKIEQLREQISTQRTVLGVQVGQSIPKARKAAAIGGALFTLRKFSLIIRPFFIAALTRIFARFGFRGLFKIAGLSALTIGAVKMLRSDDDD